MTIASPVSSPASRRRVSEAAVASLLVGGLVVFLLIFLGLPLWTLLSKSFQNDAGAFVGLANYARYVSTPALVGSLINSLMVAIISTVIVIPIAFVYAYGLTRSTIPAKGLFQAIALLPIFAPSLLPALSFIYIFGNQGFAKDLLFGASIYGPVGIVLAHIFYCLPPAVMILATALSLADGRLYEAADAMGTSRSRVFTTITLPGARYGLVSAAVVVFTLVITDFGIAKVIGGQFSVLATDAYKQVVGQQNFEMGAVVGMILLIPAVFAFAVDRWLRSSQTAQLSARSVPYVAKPRAARDLTLLAFCMLIAALVIFVVAVAVWASFIRYWPYNLSLTTAHYDFSNAEPGGWQVYVTSVQMSVAAAVFGTALIFTGAYLIEKVKAAPALRAVAALMVMLPMAVPGLVLGLGYVFFFNATWNPLGFLYGGIALITLNCIIHFYTVAHVTATTALKQIDGEFEAVSASLQVPFWRTFNRVTVPISMPAILDIAVYLFVNAMTTVSAVIFLYGPTSKLAAIAIVHMDEAGFIASAAALSVIIMATAIAVKVGQVLLDRFVFGRLQVWRRR